MGFPAPIWKVTVTQGSPVESMSRNVHLLAEGRGLRRPRSYSWHQGQVRCSRAAQNLGADEEELGSDGASSWGRPVQCECSTILSSPAREAALNILPSAGSQQTFWDMSVPSEKIRVFGRHFVAAWPVPGTKRIPKF